jgi:hypothetical protein
MILYFLYFFLNTTLYKAETWWKRKKIPERSRSGLGRFYCRTLCLWVFCRSTLAVTNITLGDTVLTTLLHVTHFEGYFDNKYVLHMHTSSVNIPLKSVIFNRTTLNVWYCCLEVQNRDILQAVVNAAMKLRFPYSSGNFCTSWRTAAWS